MFKFFNCQEEELRDAQKNNCIKEPVKFGWGTNWKIFGTLKLMNHPFNGW